MFLNGIVINVDGPNATGCSATSGQEVLDGKREQAEQVMGKKPGSSVTQGCKQKL